jgi:hypothetical protein
MCVSFSFDQAAACLRILARVTLLLVTLHAAGDVFLQRRFVFSQ